MDEVFKALADPTRRSLLDELFREDGQTLSALEERLPMTRFGVMKHLRVLEEAGLVVTRTARPREAALPEPRPDPARPRPVGEQVRRALGRGAQRAQDDMEEGRMEKVFEIYIKTTPERLWEAITDPEHAAKYNFGVGRGVGLDARLAYRRCTRRPAAIAEGENLEVDPPRRLVQSFNALWGDDVKAEGTSRVTWEIEQVADSCRLTVIHDQLREGANDQIYGGWPMILSGLKTLLETGEKLTTPGSLLYANAG